MKTRKIQVLNSLISLTGLLLLGAGATLSLNNNRIIALFHPAFINGMMSIA